MAIAPVTLVLLSSCATDSYRTLPADRSAMSRPNGQHLIEKGRQLAINQCGGCHRFFFPRELAPEKWEDVLKEKSARLSLRTDQTAALMAYFKTGSKQE